MKKLGLTLASLTALFSLSMFSCTSSPNSVAKNPGVGVPGMTVLFAQHAPTNLVVSWTPNPVADNVVHYKVSLNGAAPVQVAPTVDPTCDCVKATISVPTFGSYTVSVVATNLALSTVPTSFQDSEPGTISFQLKQKAQKPSGIGVKTP
jgi:hypothetical protein